MVSKSGMLQGKTVWLVVRKLTQTENIKEWEYTAEEISTEKVWESKAKLARARTNFAKAKGIRNVGDVKEKGQHVVDFPSNRLRIMFV